MKSSVLACLGLMAGGWMLLRATAAAPTPVAPPATENAALLAPFQDELARELPAHVAGLAVAEATVAAVNVVPYCPFRTAQCGRNPTCGHPKKILRIATLTITRALANPANLELPATLEHQAMDGRGPDLKPGQRVCVSFYAYRNGVPPQISRVVPAPEAPAP